MSRITELVHEADGLTVALNILRDHENDPRHSLSVMPAIDLVNARLVDIRLTIETLEKFYDGGK